MKNVILADAGGGLFVATWLVIAVIACFIAIQIKRRIKINLGIFGIILEKFGLVLEKIGEKKIPAPPAALPTQTIPRKCPQCGAELKPDVSEGLCPACLLQRGIATEGGAPPGTPPFVPPTIPDLARLFPQLEILELIGKGGMGAVYKARQPALDRFVALKILAPRSGGDLDFAERFTREARALAKLSHPNIVAVYDFGVAAGVPPAVEPGILPGGGPVDVSKIAESSSADPDGRMPSYASGRRPDATTLHYFIMEYVDGPNLRQVEQAGKLPPRGALEIIPQICAALQFAHDEGIVHRDIKPENVLLDKKGRVKIADFGLAKILGQEPNDFRLTGARDVVGTPHYMAPEQVEKPSEVDHRADIYSLGVVFYEMLTGELPLGKFQPPSSCARGMQIDVRLDEVVLHALEKEPARRYQQVSEVKTRVETIAMTSRSSGHESAPSESQSRFTSVATTKKTGWWFCSPLASPEVREIVAHMTPAEKRESMWLGAMFGIWNAATWFTPVWVIFFMVKPLNNWKLAVAAWAIGILFYPVWFRIMWKAVCSTEWARAQDIKAESLRKVSFNRQNVLKAVAIFVVFMLAAFGMQKAILHFYGIPELLKSNSFYIGQTCFPKGDSIEITSVKRTKNQMTVKGHYNLVSHDNALLVLYVTITNDVAVPTDSKQQMQIPKGRGDFELIHSHLVPGLPHVSMYADGKPFAAIYFGTKAEALEESMATWITNATPASAESWSPTLAPGEKPDLQKILDEANTLVSQGRYEESLQRHIWHFNHAQEYGDPYQSVVRLTSGLSGWEELGRRYPKAKQALIQIRDNKTREIADGRGYSEMFDEVQAINHELQDDDATYGLFKIIREKDSKLAGQCYFYLEDLLVSKGEYQWCFSHMGDPRSRFDSICQSFEMEIDNQKRMAALRQQTTQRVEAINQQHGLTNAWSPPNLSERLKKSAEDRFVGQTRQLIEILVATDHKADVEKIRDEAVAVLDDPRLKSAVNDAELKIQKPDTIQTLAEQPPVVVETWPVSGARDVEPGIVEIRVRFSKGMADGGWSWSTAWGNSTPETVGRIHYEPDLRTCVLKAKLEPGQTYAWWLNSDKLRNFTDRAGRPAVPYLLIFQTKLK